MTNEPIYLDHHSTTPCDPRVVEKMLPYFSEIFGNAAAVTHAHGRKASTALEESRARVASLIGVRPNEVHFTSGATESNNIVLRALAVEKGRHVVTTAMEHSSILRPLQQLGAHGVEVTVLQPDRYGFIAPEQVREAIRPDTSLVSVIAASAEIGTVEPVAEIGSICRERGVLLHTDATQAFGKIPVDLGEWNCDLASMSAHKFYGPKGIGALYIRRGIPIESPVTGGGQEKGVRSGTVNIPGVVGLAEALALAVGEMGEESRRVEDLRNHLWDELLAGIEDVVVHGPREKRLPGNLNASFGTLDAEALLHAMRRFSLSTGAACSSSRREPSKILTAIGVPNDVAMGAVRFGLGRSTTREQIELLLSDLKSSVARLREISV